MEGIKLDESMFEYYERLAREKETKKLWKTNIIFLNEEAYKDIKK